MSGEAPNQPEDQPRDQTDAAPQASSEAAPESAVKADAPVAGGEASPAESVASSASEPTTTDVEAATGKAPAAVASIPTPPDSIPLDLPDLGAAGASTGDKGIDLLNDVALNLKIELGRASMCIEDVLKLGEGSIVELDKLAGDPVDVFVNDRLVARGEVLVLNDNFCVRVSEIVSNEEEVPV